MEFQTFKNISDDATFQATRRNTPVTRQSRAKFFLVSPERVFIAKGNTVADPTDPDGYTFTIAEDPYLETLGEYGGLWITSIDFKIQEYVVMYKLTDWAGNLQSGTAGQKAATGSAAAGSIKSKLIAKYSPIDIDYVTT